jgi:hypothetical protein
MNISVTDALPLFTNTIVAKYSDHQKPKSFGRSFFTEVETNSKLASLVSERGLNLIANDIPRGQRGELNVFDKSTQNVVFPPFFDKLINLTDLDGYDYLHVEGVTSQIAWGRFLDDFAARMMVCMNQIDRRYELMCWQVLETGIIQLSSMKNISYGRKAGSLVNALTVGGYWTTNGVNPVTGTLMRGAVWNNETGKMNGNTLNVIFGSEAWSAWVANSTTKDNDLKFNNNLTVLAKQAVRDSTGKTFLGSTTYDAFNFNFFTYSDFYQDDDGTVHKFVNPKKVIILPEETANVLTYCAVPLLTEQGAMLSKGKFSTYRALDQFAQAEFRGVRSAGIPIQAAVDQVYTEQVVA